METTELSDLIGKKYEADCEKYPTRAMQLDSEIKEKTRYFHPEKPLTYHRTSLSHSRINDDILARIVEEEKDVKNENGFLCNYLTVALDHPEVQCFDTLFNYKARKFNMNKHLMDKYAFSYANVIFFKTAIEEYFGEAFDNWVDYKVASRKGILVDSEERLRKLKYLGLKDLKDEAKDRNDFVNTATKRYIKSFKELQESKRAKHPLLKTRRKGLVELGLRLVHLLNADFDMKYLVVADIYEKALRTKDYNKEVHQPLVRYLINIVQGFHQGTDIDDITVFTVEAEKLNKKLKSLI